jgi:hypothetical protein
VLACDLPDFQEGPFCPPLEDGICCQYEEDGICFADELVFGEPCEWSEENRHASSGRCYDGYTCTMLDETYQCIKSECPEHQTECGGECVNLETDKEHCGECFLSCLGGTECRNGRCESGCIFGEVLCDGKCIDPYFDRKYCGAFNPCYGEGRGEECQSGTVCAGGRCTVSCLDMQVHCGDVCVEPEKNNEFCGASGDCLGENAGEKCLNGTVCINGVCESTCLDGQVLCEGKCIDPNTNNMYCGAVYDCLESNMGMTCPSGTRCENGLCIISCLANQVLCDDKCIDPATDNEYCGAMDGCTSASKCEAGMICKAGECTLSCSQGLSLCDSKCVDVKTDPAHCSACNKVCKIANASSVYCSAGVCKAAACAAGYFLHAGKCEKNTDTQCGSKGNNCANLAGWVYGICTPAGVCVATECEVNYHIQDRRSVADSSVCCGASCENCSDYSGMNNVLDASCERGVCKLFCEFAYANCDDIPENGCEASTFYDNDNCGGCGIGCDGGTYCNFGVCS